MYARPFTLLGRVSLLPGGRLNGGGSSEQLCLTLAYLAILLKSMH